MKILVLNVMPAGEGAYEWGRLPADIRPKSGAVVTGGFDLLDIHLVGMSQKISSCN
jgi:hypothetical protein